MFVIPEGLNTERTEKPEILSFPVISVFKVFFGSGRRN
jgi:hypothetical protein